MTLVYYGDRSAFWPCHPGDSLRANLAMSGTELWCVYVFDAMYCIAGAYATEKFTSCYFRGNPHHGTSEYTEEV